MVTNEELDISFDQGLLEGVLENAPAPVKAALTGVVNGLTMYRDKIAILEQDLEVLQQNYNNLVALSSQYLNLISELRQQTEGLLIETQRDLHHHEQQ